MDDPHLDPQLKLIITLTAFAALLLCFAAPVVLLNNNPSTFDTLARMVPTRRPPTATVQPTATLTPQPTFTPPPTATEGVPSPTAALPSFPTVPPSPPTAGATPAPQEFSGQGDTILNFSPITPAVIVNGTHTGERNFIVRMKDQEGDLVGIPINCIGICEDNSLVRVGSLGKVFLEVNADGPWIIRISAP